MIFISVALIVAAVFLVVAILLQSGKEKGMSSALGGASSDTYYGKNKANSRDYILNKLTTVVAIVFAVLVIVSFVIQDDGIIKTSYNDFVNGLKDQTTTEVTTDGNTTSGETTTPETTTGADTTTGDEQ